MAETHEGEPIIDDSFLVLFNAWQDQLTFRLPPVRFGRRWALELSTADPSLEPGAWETPVRAEVEVGARSLLLLRRVA
jgi:isoamylase